MLPFLYEAENLESWREKIFWEKRRRPTKQGIAKKAEVLFDEGRPKDASETDTEEQSETIQPLGEELVDTLVDLLFYTNFTLPPDERTKNKVTYSIWQNGVGCNTPIGSSAQLESNRCEVIRLLLTMSSEALYISPRADISTSLIGNVLMFARRTAYERGQDNHLLSNVP